MASSRFVEVIDKEISEIKTNSVPNNTKILKQLFASGLVIIGEYSPRLRLGEYCNSKVAGRVQDPAAVDNIFLLALGMEIMKYTLENIFNLSYYRVNNNTT